MSYLQKTVITHGVSEDELANRWDKLPEEAKRKLFRYASEGEEADIDVLVVMELGYLSEVCSELTVQRVVTALSAM